MTSPRFWSVILLLLLAAAALYRRGDKDYVPPSLPLSQFPMTIDQWTGTDNVIPQETLDVLGKGDFLNRTYTSPAAAISGDTAAAADATPRQSVGLFIGYFPTQRSGQSIHSPQNCLPGAGWTFASSGVVDIALPDGRVFQVGDYVITNGAARDEVLYWYQSHGRAIANDYKAKLYMLTDSIRYNRTDAALVRIVAPVLGPAQGPEGQQAAHERALAFARQTIPLLPAYIPN